nr:EOG090X0IKQ [Eulimnadia texana]
MASIVLKSLSLFLGLFFIFVGILKLTPYFSRELHKDLRKEYVKYAKVFPLTLLFGIKISAKWYRRTVGASEILCGIILSFIPHGKSKIAANVTLLILIIGAIYSHWMVEDKLERTAPALVFFFMLCCRLVVEWQLRRQAKKAAQATTATQTSNPRTKQE